MLRTTRLPECSPCRAPGATRPYHRMGRNAAAVDAAAAHVVPLALGDVEGARRVLGRTLAVLGSWLDRGAWVVGLEPSCVLTLRDELQVMRLDAGSTRQLASRALLFAEFLERCCGMAGAFGYHAEHYTLSMAMAEDVLLPAVRHARAQDLVVAEGTSFRHQIRDGTGRKAAHLAGVVARSAGLVPVIAP